MKALLTGANGALGAEIRRIATLAGQPIIGWYGRADGDLRDRQALQQWIGEIRPTYIVHAAAQLPGRLVADTDLHEINVEATRLLLEVACKIAPRVRVVIVGSSAAYGRAGSGEPIGEDVAFDPIDAYGHSKAKQDEVAAEFAAGGMDVVRARMFNLVGPGQRPGLLVPDLVEQATRAERGGASKMVVGNLDTKRDFVDIRDAARAILQMLDPSVPAQAYNVCSGVATSVDSVVRTVVDLCAVPIEVTQDPDRIRRSDVPVQVGDPTRFRAATGWSATIKLAESVADLMHEWRIRS